VQDKVKFYRTKTGYKIDLTRAFSITIDKIAGMKTGLNSKLWATRYW